MGYDHFPPLNDKVKYHTSIGFKVQGSRETFEIVY